jgi:predicted dehydrogenase
MAIIAATGTARKRVIPAVREWDLCTIAAIHGRDRHRLAALAKQNGIPHYFLDAERMLDQTKPDFVFIGFPPVLHREHIRLCAERNIPVLYEKPLCFSISEAMAIESLGGTTNPFPHRPPPATSTRGRGTPENHCRQHIRQTSSRWHAMGAFG